MFYKKVPLSISKRFYYIMHQEQYLVVLLEPLWSSRVVLNVVMAGGVEGSKLVQHKLGFFKVQS